MHWIAVVVGMKWQFVISLAMLRHELGGLRWAAIKERIWLNLTRDPHTDRPRRRLFVSVVPAIAANALGRYLAIRLDTAWTDWRPALREPSYVRMEWLADPQCQGQWWILGLALVRLASNDLLGEELLFRGVLLPRMAGVFGRWVANTVLFRALPRARDLDLAQHDHQLLRLCVGRRALPRPVDGRDRPMASRAISSCWFRP